MASTEEALAGDGALAADDAAGAGLFVRKSSGLVREMGMRDALALNLGGQSPTGIGFFFIVLLAAFPGVNLTWPIVIALVGALLLNLMYSQLVAAMPRSGADFIYATRILGPAIGALVGIGYLIVLTDNGGANIFAFGNIYVPFFSQTLGNVFHSHALTVFAGTLAEHWPTMITCFLLLGLVVWLTTQRIAVVARVTFWSVVLAALAVVLLSIEFFVHGQSTFRHAIDAHLRNPKAYQQMIAAAKANGAILGTHWSAIINSLSLCAILYVGSTFANFTGGELRRPGRTFRASTLACLVVAFFVTQLLWLAMKHSMGLDYAQAASYLSTQDPATYAKYAGDVTAYVPSYGLLIASDPVSKLLIAIGFVAGAFGLALTFGALLTRFIFALSFDRLLPTRVADVRPRTHAPLNAAVLGGAGMLLFTVLLVFTTTLSSSTRNWSLMYVAVFTISSFAATILPYRRPDLYETAPKMVGRKLLGLPAITVIGGLSTVYYAVLTYFSATKAQVSGGYDTVSVVSLVVVSTLGFVFYGVSRWHSRRQGLDLSLALRELPPE
jgi:APA family basic amino acid/polyamine antiporter